MESAWQGVVSTVKFIAWLMGAIPGAMVGWALAGWLAPLLMLPDALSYRLLAGGFIGMITGATVYLGVEHVLSKGQQTEDETSVR